MRKPERVQQHTRVPAERLSTVLCTSVMGCSDSKPQPVRPVPSSPPEAGAKYEIPASASDPAQAAAEDKLNSTSSSARSAQQPPSNADAFPASAHFPKLVGNSFVARHLTQRLYEELHGRGSTRNGWNVDRAIQCAVDYPVLDGSRIAFGLFCGDAESYELLRPLLVPVVREFHGFDMETSRHACDTIPAHVSVPEPDPTGRYATQPQLAVVAAVISIVLTFCAWFAAHPPLPTGMCCPAACGGVASCATCHSRQAVRVPSAGVWKSCSSGHFLSCRSTCAGCMKAVAG